MKTVRVAWMFRPYRLRDGTTITPGFVDRRSFPEIPDEAFQRNATEQVERLDKPEERQ
jgi:hypothetical protein